MQVDGFHFQLRYTQQTVKYQTLLVTVMIELISVDYLEHSLVHSTWSANAFYHTYQFLRTSCKLNTLITTLHRLSIFILLPTLKS